MQDSFGTAGKWQELLDYFGLRAKNIVDLVKRGLIIKNKKE
jgi:transketolase